MFLSSNCLQLAVVESADDTNIQIIVNVMFLNSVLFNNVFEFCNCLTKISCQVSLQAAILFFLLTEKPLCTFASTSRLTAICKSQSVWPDSGLPDEVLLILSELADLACWRTQHHLIRLSKLIFESWLFAKNPKKPMNNRETTQESVKITWSRVLWIHSLFVQKSIFSWTTLEQKSNRICSLNYSF